MDDGLHIFGVDVSNWPKWGVLAVSVGGIFLSFILQGTANETIYQTFKLKESLFLTFVQFFAYSSLSFPFFIDLFKGKAKLHAPIWFYLVTSVFLVSSMGFSNFSLERLSFPTQVLFRSSKLIPVMLGSAIFLKKKYSILEVVAVLLIVVGLIGISMSDKMANNKFDTIGLIAVLFSLFCDAFASNLEEKSFSTYGAPQNEVIAMIYLFGSLEVGLVSVFTGQLSKGIYRCCESPKLIAYIVLFSYLGAVGIQFVYVLIKKFGSLVAVMVTSLRKAFTVCLSFILFSDKKFTVFHLLSILSIASGISLNIFAKPKKKEMEDEQKVLEESPSNLEAKSDDFAGSDQFEEEKCESPPI